MSRIRISQSDLRKIVDGAMRTFHESRHLPEDSKEAQAFLMISGLRMFLIANGHDPIFDIEPAKEERVGYTPIDDLG